MRQTDVFPTHVPAPAKSGYTYIPGKFPDAALIVAWAIMRLGNLPAGHDEPSIIRECQRMRREGLHPFKLGSVKLADGRPSNIRNRLQRNCANASIYQEKWGRRPHNYAALFFKVGEKPAKWRVLEGFDLEDFTGRLAHIKGTVA
jgi:hypothetical protein